MPDDDRASQACAYLRMLLLRPGEYRVRWEKHAPPTPAGTHPAELSYPAVAAVVSEVASPPGLSPAVEAALDGRALDSAYAELFIEAFAIRARHAHRLRELLRGSPAVRVLSGGAPAQDLDRAARARGHETLSLHELHTVGADGRPVEHETIQVIKASVDGLSSYPLRFDTDELVVDVVRGGRVGDHIYRVDDYLYGVDILLDRQLAAGETALLQFHTSFAYRADPPPELRRGVLRPVNDLTIWVRFHPDRPPAHVWQARWDRLDQARVVERTEAELDSELSVHARFGAVESAVVGFYWEFA
jgi:hypothetical protein